MKGTTRRQTMERPLTKPQSMPKPMPTAKEATQAMKVISLLPGTISRRILAHMTEEKATTEPVERSMPPLMMTRVMPRAAMATMEESARMVRMLPRA